MGIVYAGINIETQDRVAIKVVAPHLATDPKILAKVRSEARLLAQVVHPAVVPYRVFARDPALNVHYIVTDLVIGNVLADRINGAATRAGDVLILIRRLAEGLRALHVVGVIHCDVAPDNVLLPAGRMDQARIVDLGIAKSLGLNNRTLVLEGFTGKLGYAAPEQFGINNWRIGPWTDVYGLGLVALNAAIGRPTNMGDTLADAVAKRRHLPPLDDVPLPIRELLRNMLIPNPARRLASMDAVLSAIDVLRPDVGVGAEGALGRLVLNTGPPPSRPDRKRNALPMISVAMIGTVMSSSSSPISDKLAQRAGTERVVVMSASALTSGEDNRRQQRRHRPAVSIANQAVGIEHSSTRIVHPVVAIANSAVSISRQPDVSATIRPRRQVVTFGKEGRIRSEAERTAAGTGVPASRPNRQPHRAGAAPEAGDLVHPPPGPPVLAQGPMICRQYDATAWRTIGTLPAFECVRRGLMRQEINYLQVGADVLVRRDSRFFVTRGKRQVPVPSAALPAEIAAKLRISAPASTPVKLSRPSGASEILASGLVICRRYKAPKWRTIGTMPVPECVRRGFMKQGTNYLQVGTDVLVRHESRFYVMRGKTRKPISLATAWTTADGKPGASNGGLTLVEFTSPELSVCRHFDGSAWKRLGRLTMRGCAERAFARAGAGFVKSGEVLLTMRAKRIGVWQQGRWYAVARLSDDYNSTVGVTPI